jgi:hypothetical protein
MGWGWFSAHRYRQSESAARTVARDGRPLQRPWRCRSAVAEQQVRRIRSERRQPVWPRALGWSLLGVAALAVIETDHPLSRARGASSARPIESLVCLVAESPAGPCEGVPPAFRWGGEASPPFQVVVLDAGYRELARLDATGPRGCAPPAAVAAVLAAGGTFHWFVEGERAGQRTRSPLESFEIH